MRVEWVIMADRAEAVANKLYLMGGGWAELTVNSGFPVQHHCGVAISIEVPWNETNEPHAFSVSIADEDESAELVAINGHIEMGRPPGIRPGTSQRSQLAVNMPLVIPRPGGYVVKTRIDGVELNRTTFTVNAGPNLSTGAPGM